jgi:hypothetical protein
MFDLFVIALLCLIYAKGAKTIIAYKDRGQKWHSADAQKRERIVRNEFVWRIIGRVVGAAGLGLGAFAVASPALAVAWGLTALRLLKPIREEMRAAAAYRSTGSDDEAPYGW